MSRAALLLIPGMLTHAGIWRAVSARLQQAMGARLQLLVADVSTQDSIADMAEDAWRLLGQVAPEVPCGVVGFSMGGYVALEMLAHARRPLRMACLVSTSARAEPAEGVAQREKTMDSLRADFEQAIGATALYGTHRANRADLASLLEMMRSVGPDTAVRQVQAIMRRRDLRAQLARLDLPVQVLCGQDDRITPWALSEELAALIPGAGLQQVPQAGHMLPFERPEVLAGSLLAQLHNAGH
ncbi:alpha/beta hydrolase [Acidovorax sp. Be4]|uniref:Alpha/beta hydrolase n=1 Tax=Acidovorax bellezanensis TaxID=2976702 RepID=A0ABT2PQL5_9BURK|nr:alpha/beta hydrolase [Acidovorax sp. Be4]MCT9812759.1 alpha/beta hydrolase [Acidovorax sp. Be4]